MLKSVKILTLYTRGIFYFLQNMLLYYYTNIKGVYKLEKLIFRGLLSAVLYIILSCNVFAASTEDVKQNIIKQAKTMGVEPAIVLSLAKTESGFNQNAKSVGGHIGVFQLSHSTAKRMGLDPYNLDDNIKGGITYFKNMYDRFGSMELALAAYNSGPEAVKRHNNAVPKHSRPFVNRIMNDYKYYKEIGI